jgi:hypothetical protein
MARFWICLLCCLISSVAFANDYHGVKNIEIEEDFIFGFGSLVNSNSRNSTAELGIKPVIPARISKEFGYNRVWNVKVVTGMTALGLERSSPENASTINGIIYPVSKEILELYDKREESYNRVIVPWTMIEQLGPMTVTSGKLWVYIPKHSEVATPSSNYPILQSYVDTTALGFLEYGEDFAQEFINTTSGWSNAWINDRVIPNRPWVYCKDCTKIDKLLLSELKHDNISQMRKNPMYK